MWEHEDYEQKAGGKKSRKLNKVSLKHLINHNLYLQTAGHGAIEQFMQPTSALANKKIPLKQSKKASKVTVGQSKDIMDGILGELDDQDDDELEDVNYMQAQR